MNTKRWALDFDAGYGEGEHNFGWTTIVDAPTHAAAVRMIRAAAGAASLLAEDITDECVVPASQDHAEWYRHMSGP